YTIGVKLDPGGRGGSRYVCDQLNDGDTVPVSAPRNHFALSPEARHSVLVAGGIGITPIRAMIAQLQAQSASFEVHYASRLRATMAFRDEFEQRDGIHLHYDDESGPVLDIAAIVAAAPESSHFYCC